MSVLKPILEAVPGVVRDPKRSAVMVVAAAAANAAYGFALFGAVAAFGSAPPPLGVLVVYLVAATIAAIAPTPGGLGAMEVALVAGLTRLAVPGGQAVAATLAFRLATSGCRWHRVHVLQRGRRRDGYDIAATLNGPSSGRCLPCRVDASGMSDSRLL